ncbi:MAG TPA: hypothetical protein VGM53_25525 [Streptosporangiaceae bacterium]|jgi:hypothetical protein
MFPSTMPALVQDRLAELHHQTHRAALAHAARGTRRQPPPGLRAALTGWARRLRPAPEGL